MTFIIGGSKSRVYRGSNSIICFTLTYSTVFGQFLAVRLSHVLGHYHSQASYEAKAHGFTDVCLPEQEVYSSD